MNIEHLLWISIIGLFLIPLFLFFLPTKLPVIWSTDTPQHSDVLLTSEAGTISPGCWPTGTSWESHLKFKPFYTIFREYKETSVTNWNGTVSLIHHIPNSIISTDYQWKKNVCILHPHTGTKSLKYNVFFIYSRP